VSATGPASDALASEVQAGRRWWRCRGRHQPLALAPAAATRSADEPTEVVSRRLPDLGQTPPSLLDRTSMERFFDVRYGGEVEQKRVRAVAGE